MMKKSKLIISIDTINKAIENAENAISINPDLESDLKPLVDGLKSVKEIDPENLKALGVSSVEELLDDEGKNKEIAKEVNSSIKEISNLTRPYREKVSTENLEKEAGFLEDTIKNSVTYLKQNKQKLENILQTGGENKLVEELKKTPAGSSKGSAFTNLVSQWLNKSINDNTLVQNIENLFKKKANQLEEADVAEAFDQGEHDLNKYGSEDMALLSDSELLDCYSKAEEDIENGDMHAYADLKACEKELDKRGLKKASKTVGDWEDYFWEITSYVNELKKNNVPITPSTFDNIMKAIGVPENLKEKFRAKFKNDIKAPKGTTVPSNQDEEIGEYKLSDFKPGTKIIDITPDFSNENEKVEEVFRNGNWFVLRSNLGIYYGYNPSEDDYFMSYEHDHVPEWVKSQDPEYAKSDYQFSDEDKETLKSMGIKGSRRASIKTKKASDDYAEMLVNFVCNTNGRGIWTSKAKPVKINMLTVDFYYDEEDGKTPDTGELRAYFTKGSWNVGKDGLIYTDPLWLKEFRTNLKAIGLPTDVDYSEQGMQGPDYVSLDVSSKFIVAFLKKVHKTSSLKTAAPTIVTLASSIESQLKDMIVSPLREIMKKLGTGEEGKEAKDTYFQLDEALHKALKIAQAGTKKVEAFAAKSKESSKKVAEEKTYTSYSQWKMDLYDKKLKDQVVEGATDVYAVDQEGNQYGSFNQKTNTGVLFDTPEEFSSKKTSSLKIACGPECSGECDHHEDNYHEIVTLVDDFNESMETEGLESWLDNEALDSGDLLIESLPDDSVEYPNLSTLKEMLLSVLSYISEIEDTKYASFKEAFSGNGKPEEGTPDSNLESYADPVDEDIDSFFKEKQVQYASLDSAGLLIEARKLAAKKKIKPEDIVEKDAIGNGSVESAISVVEENASEIEDGTVADLLNLLTSKGFTPTVAHKAIEFVLGPEAMLVMSSPISELLKK